MITLQPYLGSHAQLLKTQGDTFPETHVSTRAILLEIWPTLVKLALVIFFHRYHYLGFRVTISVFWPEHWFTVDAFGRKSQLVLQNSVAKHRLDVGINCKIKMFFFLMQCGMICISICAGRVRVGNRLMTFEVDILTPLPGVQFQNQGSADVNAALCPHATEVDASPQPHSTKL